MEAGLDDELLAGGRGEPPAVGHPCLFGRGFNLLVQLRRHRDRSLLPHGHAKRYHSGRTVSLRHTFSSAGSASLVTRSVESRLRYRAPRASYAWPVGRGTRTSRSRNTATHPARP